MGTIGHNDMLSLPYNSETRLFERPNGIEVIYPCKLEHELN